MTVYTAETCPALDTHGNPFKYCGICNWKETEETTMEKIFPVPDRITPDFQLKARLLVVEYFNKNVDPTDNFAITIDDVYVVWFTKTLQNWKAMLSTTVPDGMYYELTYDGDAKATYIDAYKKINNVAISDELVLP